MEVTKQKLLNIADKIKNKKHMAKILKIVDKLDKMTTLDKHTPLIPNNFSDTSTIDTSNVRYENDPHRIGFYENTDLNSFPGLYQVDHYK